VLKGGVGVSWGGFYLAKQSHNRGVVLFCERWWEFGDAGFSRANYSQMSMSRAKVPSFRKIRMEKAAFYEVAYSRLEW